MKRISVIICTFNRPLYLVKSLDSLEQQTLQKSEYEIIIVDSGASDDTSMLLKKYGDDTDIRVIPVKEAGLSEARNIGIRNAEGKITAFLDDDAIVVPDWLDQILSTFETYGPGICACGGKVDLIWEQERPGWLNDKMLVYLGKFDRGETIIHIGGLVGLNMAFDKRVFEKIGYFDVNLGRIGGNLLSGDEVEFFNRMRKRNLKILYSPGIHAWHHVTIERITKDFFYDRYYWQGRSDALIHQKEKKCIDVFKRFLGFLYSIPFLRSEQMSEYIKCILRYYRGYHHQILQG
jgi:glycosyltransferase involved in cell wall biosynthesis